jgi:hypothetical protein
MLSYIIEDFAILIIKCACIWAITVPSVDIMTYLGFPWWHDLCTLLRFHSNVTVPDA